MGGGRHSNCSMLEAIALCEEITGKPFQRNMSMRTGAATISGGSATFHGSRSTIQIGSFNTTCRKFCGKSMN